MSSSSQLPLVFVAGGMAGVAVDSLFYPLDTLKTRLQSSPGISHTGGTTHLYRGIPIAMLGSAMSAGCWWSVYVAVQRKIKENRFSSPLTPIISVTCAELIACSVRVPCDRIKQQMQAMQANSIGPIVQRIISTHGLSGFWHGYLSTLSRELPFSTLQLPLYEYIRSHFLSWNTYDAALCGAMTGCICAAITTPVDVVRTRIMLDHGKLRWKDSIWNVWNEKGIGGFSAGIIPRTISVGIGGAVFFGVFEWTCACMGITYT